MKVRLIEFSSRTQQVKRWAPLFDASLNEESLLALTPPQVNRNHDWIFFPLSGDAAAAGNGYYLRRAMHYT